jgi:hypothetical protein
MNGLARRAHWKVKAALRAGQLVRPSACSHCGRNEKHIDAHHPDHTKPLEVVWLCRSCHRDFDMGRTV